jgi:hypothetical protein
MRKGTKAGVSGTVSALLTVLLLVAGFAVSTGLLSAIYSAQSEVLRKAINVGEAVSERLQAFVYEDVRTNRTLLTVRNVGSVGSEVEYLMAVGYDGSVLAEARPGDTIKLGTQQSFTLFLSDLLGPGFDNYTEVRSRMATLYLKTVKGGVFGSGYMAPPSVMTAAYATFTTTISTTETSTTTLPIQTGRETITSWTATVILDNPDHWPVEAYVGVAFADQFRFGYWGGGNYWGPVTDMDGFPNWGLQPGLAAKNSPSGSVTNVTSANQIKLPKRVTCWEISSNSLVGWGGNTPIHKYSELGPTYINLKGRVLALEVRDYVTYTEYRIVCDGGDELFEPRGTTVRLRTWYIYVGQAFHPWTTLTTRWRVPLTAYWTVTNPAGTRTTTFYSATYPRTILTLIGENVLVTPITKLSTTVTATYRTTVTTTWWTQVFFGPTATTVKGPVTATKTLAKTITGSYTLALAYPEFTHISYVAEVRDAQVATFPRTLVAKRDYIFCYSTHCVLSGYYVRNYFDLAYIKVVDLWNTTNVLAYVDGRNSNTVALRVDRPIGIAAVYVYSGTEARLPPPPPRLNIVPGCIERANICPTYGYGTAIIQTSPSKEVGPLDSGICDGTVTVTFKCTDPNDKTCNVWVAPSPGTYSDTDPRVSPCPKAPDGTITCTVPEGTTLIAGQGQKRNQTQSNSG